MTMMTNECTTSDIQRERDRATARPGLGPTLVAGRHAMKVGLVACGARKLAHPAPARALYTGTLFRLASAYANRVCDRWYILSGLHGLVSPCEVLTPYDLSLGDTPVVCRWAWSRGVFDDLRALGLDNGNTRWLVLAGWAYREFLVPCLPGPVEVPLAGLGIGQQIARLKRMLVEEADARYFQSS
jgi:hypothetical protein